MFETAGKGIADQDRNILSNQLLILGFLRSAATLLRIGPVPVVTPSRKRARESDDDEREEESDDSQTQEAPSVQARGTLIITLRNVPPYTLWSVSYVVFV